MKVTCYQFKHFAQENIELTEALQVLVGNNGAGKSTLCEAISILVNASNPHHTSWEEKCSFEHGGRVEVKNDLNRVPLSRGMVDPFSVVNESQNELLRRMKDQGVQGKEKDLILGDNLTPRPPQADTPLDRGATGNEWALRLHLGEQLFQSIFDGKNRSPKWSLDEQSCSKPKYEDKMPYRAFWIQSDHLRVISGEPSERRNFLDDMLVAASPGYEKILRNYRTALTSRNRVIQSILDKEATKSDLSSWNTMLAEYAVQVIAERRKFFEWLEGDGIETDKNSLEKIPPTPLYQGGMGLHLPGPVKITLAERRPLDIVSKENFLKLLADYTERDLVVGRTTVGPHLDEIGFSVEINNAWSATKYILSRGENKILLLAFIRLLGKYVLEISGKKPFFLLDDVLSELDTDHTRILCDLFSDTTTIMTTQPNHIGGLPVQISKIEMN